jgi:hypothetical protein
MRTHICALLTSPSKEYWHSIKNSCHQPLSVIAITTPSPSCDIPELYQRQPFRYTREFRHREVLMGAAGVQSRAGVVRFHTSLPTESPYRNLSKHKPVFLFSPILFFLYFVNAYARVHSMYREVHGKIGCMHNQPLASFDQLSENTNAKGALTTGSFHLSADITRSYATTS